jgi:hypothetical protein
VFYVLDATGCPHPVDDPVEWASFTDADRRVAQASVGDAWVSTVFLGIDHGFGFNDAPVLWETMIFGGSRDQEQHRYTSQAEALAGHARLVRELRAAP